MGRVRVAAASLLLFAAGVEAQVSKKIEAPGKFLASVEIQGSQYRQENLDWNEMKGNKVGLAGRAGYLSATGNYFALDVRVARGDVDIDTGTAKANRNDRLSDIRFLAGHRFSAGSGTLTPYFGLGRLRLVNLTGGMAPVGAPPFPVDQVERRTDTLRYVAIGADWSIGSAGSTTFELNAEFNQLLRGRQQTEFSTLSQDNTQNYGNGLRGSLLVGVGSWAVGPFASRWKVKTSNAADFWVEPETTTTETGVRVRFTFQ
jgi:hypothetical protein